MDRCNAEVQSVPYIGTRCIEGGSSTNNLIKDLTHAFDRYGPYKVRCAALQQISGDNARALADVGLAAYTKYDELYDISNKAFYNMTLEERHREFCTHHKIDFWWPVGC